MKIKAMRMLRKDTTLCVSIVNEGPSKLMVQDTIAEWVYERDLQIWLEQGNQLISFYAYCSV